MPDAETIIAYGGTIALITTIVVQLIKTGLIDPHSTDTPARTALIYAIQYALNLGLLLVVLAFNNQLDGGQFLLYLTTAFGTSVAGSASYRFIRHSGNPAKGPAAGSGGYSAEPEQTPQQIVQQNMPGVSGSADVPHVGGD